MPPNANSRLSSPYPYFGGKSWVMDNVWKRFGDVRNFVDPFFGSGASLLERPEPFGGNETVNDIDGYIANFWRAITADPETVVHYADWPVNENDLTARHLWLSQRKDRLGPQLEADPDWCDPQIAGWWVWGMACWIGGGFCSGKGPWQAVENEDGTTTLQKAGNSGQGVQRKLVHLGNSGLGVQKRRVHLGDSGQGVQKKLVHLGGGRGVQRKRVHMKDRATTRRRIDIFDWFVALAERFRRVRVCCGDWKRVTTPAVTTCCGTTAMFLDPPYSAEADRSECYSNDDFKVAHEVREWAIAHGDDPLFRIALCGYEGEHQMPPTWEKLEWKSPGGMARGLNSKGKINRHRERIWFSPHCLKPERDRYPLFWNLEDEDLSSILLSEVLETSESSE